MPPAFNSYFGNNSVASNSTLTLSSVTLTSGNLAVVCIESLNASTLSVNSFSDTLGNTWNQLATPWLSTSDRQLWLYYSLISTGGTANISVTLSGSATNIYINGADFTGCSGTVDESNNYTLASASYAPTIQITQNLQNELLVSFMTGSAATSGNAGSGWTTFGTFGDTRSVAQYRINTNPGTYSGVLSGNGTLSQAFGSIIVAFEPTGAGSGPPAFVQHVQKSLASAVNTTTFAITIGNGHAVLISVLNGNSASAAANYPSSISDNLGNTWTNVPNTEVFTTTNVGYGANGGSSSLWYCSNCIGGASTVTVNWPNNVTSGSDIFADEYAGVLSPVAGSGTTGSGTASSVTLSISSSPGTLAYVGVQNNNALTNPWAQMNLTQRQVATTTGQAVGETALASSGTFSATVTFGGSAGYVGSGAQFSGAVDNSRVASGDCYVFPYAPVRNIFGDCWVVVPQRQVYGDCYVVNPSGIIVALSYVKLAGTIQFKINPINGYVSILGTLNTPSRQYVALLGTINKKNNFSFTSLAGWLQIKTRGYVNLTGTIQYRMTRNCSGDCVVSVFNRGYVTMTGTINQKVNTTVGAGGSGAAQGYGQYPANTYVKLAAWMLNPRAGLP